MSDRSEIEQMTADWRERTTQTLDRTNDVTIGVMENVRVKIVED